MVQQPPTPSIRTYHKPQELDKDTVLVTSRVQQNFRIPINALIELVVRGGSLVER